MRGLFSLCIAAAALPFCAGAKPADTVYEVRDLGLGSYSWAAAINDQGVIAANKLLLTGSRQCFVIDGPRVTTLDVGTECRGINNHGEVVGDIERSGQLFAFRWRNGVLTELPKPNVVRSSASAINDKGKIVGWAWLTTSYGAPFAVLWDANSLTELGPFTPVYYYDNSFALAINDREQIAGYFQYDDYFKTGFTWQDGSHQNLSVKPSTATGINKFGVLSGYTGNESCYTQAFLMTNGVATFLPWTGASQLTGLNDSGLAAGWMSERPSCVGWTRAIVWDGVSMTTLPSLEGGDFATANAINKHGEVVGHSNSRAVVWTKRR